MSLLQAAVFVKNLVTGAFVPGVLGGGNYVACPAGATTPLGSAGAAGDYLDGVTVVPLTAAAAACSIEDGATSIEIFAGGGTTALADLKPFYVPVKACSQNGGWSVVAGANAKIIAVGVFK